MVGARRDTGWWGLAWEEGGEEVGVRQAMVVAPCMPPVAAVGEEEVGGGRTGAARVWRTVGMHFIRFAPRMYLPISLGRIFYKEVPLVLCISSRSYFRFRPSSFIQLCTIACFRSFFQRDPWPFRQRCITHQNCTTTLTFFFT